MCTVVLSLFVPIPYLLVVSVVWKPLHDEVVDPVERCLLLRGVLYGHGDEGDVGVGRLDHVLGSRVLGHAVVGRVGGAHVPAGADISQPPFC